MQDDEDLVAIQGPVELVGGELTLRIPLDEGGEELSPSARGISRIDGEFLHVTIPGWLAEKIGLSERDQVIVDNRNGKFNITRVTPTLH